MTQNISEDNKPCPMELVQKAIVGKWKIPILWALALQTMRYGELKQMFPDIAQTMLTRQLRELERDGFVIRKVYPEVPPRVEYSLTTMGHSFFPIIQQMYNWGEENLIQK